MFPDKNKTVLAAALLAIFSVTMNGCESPSPEEKLQQAGAELGKTESALAEVDQAIEATEDELARLREERAQLKDEVRTLEERVEARATDVAIFRSVQSALLENTDLLETAIAVEVEDQVVTLRGNAVSRAQLEKAVQVARQIPGVDAVITRARIDSVGATDSQR